MKTVHVPNKLDPKVVGFNRFIPYTLQDFGVVIAHSIRMRNRWEWFWPRFKESTPLEVLHNTVVVLHIRDGSTPVPEDLKEVEDTSTLLVLEREGASTVWANVKGIKHCKTRIIARLNDDVGILSPTWVDSALELFNEEPHLKILGCLTDAGVRLPYPAEPIYKHQWVGDLLFKGEYDNFAYVHGSSIIANRAIWMAYYSEMEDYCQFGQEDLRFTVLSRADGIPVINFGAYFRHRGKSHQDIIYGYND